MVTASSASSPSVACTAAPEQSSAILARTLDPMTSQAVHLPMSMIHHDWTRLSSAPSFKRKEYKLVPFVFICSLADGLDQTGEITHTLTLTVCTHLSTTAPTSGHTCASAHVSHTTASIPSPPTGSRLFLNASRFCPRTGSAHPATNLQQMCWLLKDDQNHLPSSVQCRYTTQRQSPPL